MYRNLHAVQESLFGPGVDLLSPAAHFGEYALLGFLLANALRQHMPLKRACLAAIACASLFGASDEFHQYFVPERMCDPLDWLVDTCGASPRADSALRLRKGRWEAPAGPRPIALRTPAKRSCRIRSK
ncbi:MAG: VanZ family protein [Eggerthellaceae bacterium]